MFLNIIPFNGNDDNNLAVSTSSPFTGTLATDEKLIDLNTSGEFFSIVTDGTSS
ncbi:hypothetical protein JCM14469_43680 [Desulfatiferula olefinivorans]